MNRYLIPLAVFALIVGVFAIGMYDGSNILVALGQDLGDGRWSLRVQVRPLVTYMWIAALIMAGGATHTFFEKRRRPAGFIHRAPAGMTQAARTRRKPVPHGYTLVEHKTFTLPEALLGRHIFQVFQNASL